MNISAFSKKLLVKRCTIFTFSSRYYTNQSCIPVNLTHAVFEPETNTTKSPLIILHGLLGSKNNWRSLGKAIAAKHGVQVYTLDNRNHGQSDHSNEFSYAAMSSDVLNFMEMQKMPKCSLMGHSMGGRTAMFLALHRPDVIEKLIVVDVSPVSLPQSTMDMSQYLTAMQKVIKILPRDIALYEARKFANDYFAKTIPEEYIRQHLLSNLIEVNKEFKWQANVDVLLEKFEAIVTNPLLDTIYNNDTLFVCGGASGHVRIEDHPAIKKHFPKAEFIYIKGAGHWVHSQKPEEFVNSLKKIL